MLKDLNVIITRPIKQAAALNGKLLNLSAIPHVIPMLKITLLPLTKKQIEEINHYDCLIFTSQHAAHSIAPQLHIQLRNQVAAIGEGTAKALNNYSIPIHLQPTENFSSEGLLDLDYFSTPRNKKILILGGEGGRLYLEEELTKRGACVQKCAAYRRELPEIRDEDIYQATTLQKPIILSTSCESLQNLITVIEKLQLQDWLQRTHLLVISERMRQFALIRKLSPNRLLCARNATDDAILESLIKWYPSARITTRP